VDRDVEHLLYKCEALSSNSSCTKKEKEKENKPVGIDKEVLRKKCTPYNSHVRKRKRLKINDPSPYVNIV
jgi:hypothetical protein